MRLIGEILRKKRESLKRRDKRWTQEFTAKFLGVSKRAYEYWESNQQEPEGLYRREVREFLSTGNRRLWILGNAVDETF
jgi:transcriptional regulator with XRE-family HTH domain